MRTAVPSPGDVVWIRQARWRVERAQRDRGVVRVEVAGADGSRTFLTPFDRLAAVARRARPRRVRPQHGRARLASRLSRAFGTYTLPAAALADVTILPYQLEPALAFATGTRRVLVADDVGLGKTIQAGAVIAELLRRNLAARVLVLLPAALRRQWTDELQQRFHVACTATDAAALDRHTRDHGRQHSPWIGSGVWIASSDFVKQPHVLAALPSDPWDLLVIDEAHGVCGDSSRHDACDLLARHARRVLLLTATPHGGDEIRFARLTAIGELAGVDDPLIVFRRTRQSLGLRVDRRVRWHAVSLSDDERLVLDALAMFERAVLHAAGRDRRDHALLLLSVFRKRALSSMTALAASLDRRMQWLDAAGIVADWQQPRLSFEDDDVLSGDERSSMSIEVGLDRGDERAWITRLQVLAAAARGDERRIARVVALVARAAEPVAIFTEFRDSLDALLPALAQVRMVETLHGGQTDAEQTRALDRFLRGDASVLLATDVASQGLNLQSRTRWVLSLDLPWNPARIEQRAGRADRIGQARPVHVTLLVARHEAEAGLLTHLLRRSLAAQRSLGADVLRDVTPDPARVRDAILSGSPLSVGDATAIARAPTKLCTHLSRPAKSAARRIIRQRALARSDRGPVPDGGGPVWAVARTLPALARHGRLVAVFSVPIADRAGIVIEQHVVAVAVPNVRRDRRVPRSVIEACARAAEQSLAPRLGRLTRIAAARLPIEIARERAIGSLTDAAGALAEYEPGLFDQRAARRAEELHARANTIAAAVDRRIADLDTAASFDVGRAVLELIVM